MLYPFVISSFIYFCLHYGHHGASFYLNNPLLLSNRSNRTNVNIPVIYIDTRENGKGKSIGDNPEIQTIFGTRQTGKTNKTTNTTPKTK